MYTRAFRKCARGEMFRLGRHIETNAIEVVGVVACGHGCREGRCRGRVAAN